MQPNEIEKLIARIHADAAAIAERLKADTAVVAERLHEEAVAVAERLRVESASIATRVVESHSCRFDEPTIQAIRDLAKTFDPATTQALRDWRKMYNIGKITAVGTAVTVIVGALLLALWQGVVTLGHLAIK